MASLQDFEPRIREAALERARTMKRCIPDATVRGVGRVRDLDERALALWILHDQNPSAGLPATAQPTASANGGELRRRSFSY